MPVFYHQPLVGLLSSAIWATWRSCGSAHAMSFALVIATLLLQRSSGFAVAVTVPLLTAGAWTFTCNGSRGPAMRASLVASTSVDMPWGVFVWKFRETALGNIWKPGFPLAYGLLLVVLDRASQATDRSWGNGLTLAGLVAFVGLLATTLAPVVLALWAGLEAVHLACALRAKTLAGSVVLRSGVGLALAVLLLIGGGGRLTGLLGGGGASGLALGWNEHQQGSRLVGELDPRPGGVGLLGVGPLVVAGAAALLARRDRLVLALALGAGGLALAYVALDYPPARYDTGRLAGHARTFALVALLLALSGRLAGLTPRGAMPRADC